MAVRAVLLGVQSLIVYTIIVRLGNESFFEGVRKRDWNRHLPTNLPDRYPYLTRLENTNSSGQQFKRTMPVTERASACSYY